MAVKKVWFSFLLIGVCVSLRPNAEVVPWLRGTYTPFLEGPLAEHKGLSPLMGAIAWHSGWIAGLYTWGIGEKVVKPATPPPGVGGAAAAGVAELVAQVALERAGAGPAAVVRERYTWKDNDATTQLVRELFHEVVGDIQPTKSKTHPFFVAVKERTHLAWFLDMLKTGSIPEKTKDFKISGSKKFLELVAQSRAECGEGKMYPAFVTDQILSAYYYAVQFLPEIRQSDSLVNSFKQALERYMHALGVTSYAPVSYGVDALRAQECPRVIDEEALVRVLYQKVAMDKVPPLVKYKDFSYREASNRGSCVETMIQNFFNVLLYDAERRCYTIELLPENLRKQASKRLIDFYTHEANVLVKNTDSRDVHNAWLEVVSGLDGGVLHPASEPEHIVYLGENSYNGKSGLFELDSTPQNVLLVINTLLGTKAKKFEELSSLLSIPDHQVIFQSLSEGQGFVLDINMTPLVQFVIARGHSYAESVDQCAQDYVQPRVLCQPGAVVPFEQVQRALLTHTIAVVTEQGARYLLYGAETSDYDWVVRMANLWCHPPHEDPIFKSVADKLFVQSHDAFSRLSDDYLCANVTEKRDWPIELLFNMVRMHNSTCALELLKNPGIDVNAKNIENTSILVYSILNRLKDVALELIKKPGIDVNAQDRWGTSALDYAIRYNFRDVAIALLGRPDIDANAKDIVGTPLLVHAILKRFKDVALEFLKKPGINVNVTDARGTPILIYAITVKNYDVVRALLAKGADVYAKDANGVTVLDHAKMTGNKDIINLIETATERKARDAAGSPVPQAIAVPA